MIHRFSFILGIIHLGSWKSTFCWLMQMINDKRVLCSIIMKRVYRNFVIDAFKKINNKTSLLAYYTVYWEKFAIDHMENEPGVPWYIVNNQHGSVKSWSSISDFQSPVIFVTIGLSRVSLLGICMYPMSVYALHNRILVAVVYPWVVLISHFIYGVHLIYHISIQPSGHCFQ